MEEYYEKNARIGIVLAFITMIVSIFVGLNIYLIVPIGIWALITFIIFLADVFFNMTK